MKSTKVAGRYAQSLLELSEERKVTDAIVKDMNALVNTANDNRDLAVFFASPIIKADKKNEVLGAIFPDFHELSKAFIQLITKKGREVYLPLIAEQYDAKVKALRGIIPVTLSSATVLDEAVKTSLLQNLESQTDGKFEVTERIDESLLGGFVFRMGDLQIEASLARQFKELKQLLTK